MPIFDYYCNDCHHTIEILQKLNEPDSTHCPSCSNETLVRKLSAPFIRLAGLGWYETDDKPKDKQRNIVHKSQNTSTET